MKFKKYQIAIFKGNTWAKLRKINLYNITYATIQTMTLSRYVHTAIILPYRKKLYLYQALIGKGIVIEEVSKEWLTTKVVENEIDVFECTKKPSDAMKGFINLQLATMYNFNEQIAPMGRYSFSSLFNMIPIQFFNQSLKQKSNAPHKTICSELTHFFFFEDTLQAHKVSPAKIATDDDRFVRIY